MNRSYYGWLAGSTLSAFGDSALFFALGWAATGIAPQVAGLVLTAFTLPRAVLLLLGGVLGDRWGPRRVLLVCSVLVSGCCFGLAAAVGLAGTSAGLLILTAAVIGTVDAFALPAAGALPRLFVPDDELAKAMALSTSANQIVRLAGGPIGGLLVAAAGVVGALMVDGLTFAVQFLVLLAIRPPYDVKPRLDRKSVARDAMDGIRVAWADPVLRVVLLVVALVAAFVLPVTSLCVPLLARTHGWAASQTALIVGAVVAGGLLVTLLVARFGTFERSGLAGGLGCLLAALGITGIALSPAAWAATGAALIQGIGVGLFTSHLAPLFVRSSPRSHLTRLQSLLSLAQTIPLIASTNLLAALEIRPALILCAGSTAIAGLALVRLEPLTTCCRNDSMLSMNKTAYVGVYETWADWEVGHLLVELRTGRFTGEQWTIVTVAESAEPVTTMGGLRVVPDLVLADVEPENGDLLVLAGSALWDEGQGEAFTKVAQRFLEAGVPVAAICGATAGLARAGLLDDRKHTSAVKEYLLATGYQGGDNYVDERAVVDGDLITAGPDSPVQFARATLQRLGLASDEKLDAYEGVFHRADPSAYPALVG